MVSISLLDHGRKERVPLVPEVFTTDMPVLIRNAKGEQEIRLSGREQVRQLYTATFQ